MERIAQEWSAGNRNNRPLSCMVVDVDFFKAVNDTYGHDVGDNVLKQTAAAIKSGLRTQDVVCRVGGDEFLVICPDTSLDAAMKCAERMREAVHGAAINCGRIQIKASISVGVACRDPATADFEAFMKVADQGLYVAKQNGRDCVATTQSLAPR